MLKQYLVGKSIISDRELRWILITYYCVLLSTWIQVCFIQSKLDTDSNAGSACEESLFWLPSLKKRSFLIHPWVSLDQQINNNNVSFSTKKDPLVLLQRETTLWEALQGNRRLSQNLKDNVQELCQDKWEWRWEEEELIALRHFNQEQLWVLILSWSV